MTRYRVTISHDACTTHDVEAGSPEDAAERAMESCGSVTLCHHCSDELQMGDPIMAACVENLDDGTHVDAVDPEVAALRARVAELEAAAQPLTDGQIDSVFAQFAGRNGYGVPYLRCYVASFRDIARATERVCADAWGVTLTNKPGATK